MSLASHDEGTNRFGDRPILTSNKKLLVTSASLLLTCALLVVTRSYCFNLIFNLRIHLTLDSHLSRFVAVRIKTESRWNSLNSGPPSCHRSVYRMDRVPFLDMEHWHSHVLTHLISPNRSPACPGTHVQIGLSTEQTRPVLEIGLLCSVRHIVSVRFLMPGSDRFEGVRTLRIS